MKAHRIFKRVKNFIQREGLLGEGDSVVAGVSGGPDSIVLLDILSRLKKEMDLKITVAHFNHKIRGREADRDEEFVKQICSERRIEFVCGRLKKKSGKMSEEKLRKERYAFLKKLAQEKNAKIALGHHIDDQVETILIRLFRGTGIGGIVGMLPVSGNLIRPLLCITRSEVEEYARERKLKFVVDSTNKDPYYTRNFIRLKVIPLIKKKFPEVENALVRLSRTAFEDSLLLREMAKTIYCSEVKKEKESLKVNAFKLSSIPAALRKRVISLLLEYEFEISSQYSVIQKIEKLFFSRENKRLNVKKGLIVEKAGEDIIFSRSGIQKSEYLIKVEKIPDSVFIKEIDLKLCFEKIKGKMASFNSEKETLFDYDKITFPLYITTWKRGDYMFPFGIEGKKKLKDLFVEGKIPAIRRYLYPVIRDNNGNILWVVGVRQDKRFRVDEGTRKILKVKVEY